MDDHTCADISYVSEKDGPISSDLCFDGEMTSEVKDMLREAFEEFLENFKNDGQSAFRVGRNI